MPQYTVERIGDVKHSVSDISKAKEILDYKAEVGLEEGLSRLIEWMMNKR